MSTFDVHAMLGLGRVQALAVSPDGESLVAQVARVDEEKQTFVSQLHRITLATGAAVQLTRDPRGAKAPCFRRDGALGFLRKADDGSDQVWVVAAGAAEPERITDEPLGVTGFAFADRADVLVVETPVLLGVPTEAQRATEKERKEKGPSVLRFRDLPVRHWDAWIEPPATHLVAIDAHGRRDLTPTADREHRAGPLDPPRWALSPDGAFVIAVARTGLSTDRTDRYELRRIDTATGETRVLRLRPFAEYGAPVIAPDGSCLAITEQVHSVKALGPSELVRIDLVTSEVTPIVADWDAWPTPIAFTPDAKDLIVSAEERGHVRVHAVNLATGVRTAILSGEGSHEAKAVTPDGRHVVGLRHGFTEPPEPFVCALEEHAELEVPARLSALAAPLDHVSVESFDVTSSDGVDVQSFLVRPKGGARAPVVFWIHGGPIGQFANGWHWRWCASVLASAGYAVALPNPRGSTGRGQAFIDGIWGNRWGAECYEDLVAVADALAKRDDLDGSRMAAMGGSFGGYMSNYLAGMTDRFRAVVTHASIFHFPAFMGTTDHPAWFRVEMGGIDPHTDREAYDRYSPHARIDAWKTPTLILHGEKDYRCPIGDALMLFEALRTRGVKSELAVFPDENHFIQKPRNIAAWYETVIAFLGEHL